MILGVLFDSTKTLYGFGSAAMHHEEVSETSRLEGVVNVCRMVRRNRWVSAKGGHKLNGYIIRVMPPTSNRMIDTCNDSRVRPGGGNRGVEPARDPFVFIFWSLSQEDEIEISAMVWTKGHHGRKNMATARYYAQAHDTWFEEPTIAMRGGNIRT